MRNILFVIISTLWVQTVFAQTNKYWVFFSDKDTKSYNYQEHLSPQAIENRTLLGIDLTQYSDIPLRDNYLQSVTNEGIHVVHQSKWLNAVSAVMDEEQVAWAQQQSFIKAVKPLNQKVIVTSSKKKGKASYATAISQMEPHAMKAAGLNGEGVLVGIIDAGFFGAQRDKSLHSVFENDRVLGVKDFVNPQKTDHFNKAETFSDSHGTTVLQMITGNKPDDMQIGFATQAQFYLARTDHGSNEFRGEEDYWVSAMEWMDSLGVRVINTSLGYALGFDDPKEDYKPEQMDGKTSIISKAAQIAADEKGILLVVSAGNEGNTSSWGIISTPADAKGVLAVGATNSKGLKAGYSSIGPEFLSYLKPNVSCFSLGGTSFSAPVITGFAACLVQKKPTATNKEIFDIIEKSSHLYPYGNNYIGYGIPKASTAIELLEGKSSAKHKVHTKHTKGTVLQLKVKDKAVSRGIVFHKKNEVIVVDQKYLNGSKGKFKVKKPKDVRFSTVVLEDQVFEIEWEEEK